MATSPSSGGPLPSPRPGLLAGRRVLVANRGEIACRILRAVRDEGGLGIAVYSDADRLAPHVRLADEAHRLGPAPVAESYLQIERLLDVCRRARAELVHPGYGFFSENAEFAAAVERAGMVWVGPSPEAIRAMGDKVEARRTTLSSGVPMVPGSEALPADPAEALVEAERLGYPVLIKAAFGGGGKGMRRCGDPDELRTSIEMARRESERAFGNATIYLEKLILHPRHVEIQLLGDRHGHLIHLGERECSIQRRHQKLLEESPTPARFPGLRERMGAAAVALARSIGYTNAGTVEFLLDPNGGFYFLEMNTRLQVEHPVTEMVTGIDIVRRQLRIALGERLEIEQGSISPQGHAIECRINAEDPERGFVPSVGRIDSIHLPQGPGVRNDVGFVRGMEITPHYDSMLGKLIVWGEDREMAVRRALRALHEYRIAGVKTNIPFHRWLLAHPRFRSGSVDTAFLEEEFGPDATPREENETTAIVAAALAAYRGSSRAVPAGAETPSAWKLLGRPGGRIGR